MHLSKSVGADEVDAKFVLKSADVVLSTLFLLCNACFQSGIFPSCLKLAKIVLIYKSGDRKNLTDYTTVSILPCFTKL